MYVFRIHCVNLYEERLKRQNQYDVLNNGDGEENIEKVEEIIKALDYLYEKSGCREQICKVLEDKLPKTPLQLKYEVGKDTYEVIKRKRMIGCSRKQQFHECNLWLRFQDNTTLFPNPDQTLMKNAIEELQCLEKDFCIICSFPAVGGRPIPEEDR